MEAVGGSDDILEDFIKNIKTEEERKNTRIFDCLDDNHSPVLKFDETEDDSTLEVRQRKTTLRSEISTRNQSISDLESDKDDDNPKITHRIRLDAPIREFFDLKCTKCQTTEFLTFTTLKKHMEQEHNQQCYVTCCNRKLYRREAIMEHITYHLNPKKFLCPECGQNCKSKITLKIHMKQHIPVDKRPFQCNICSQGFVLRSQLQSHEKSHYTDEQKKFICDECGKCFAFKFVLEKHKQHMHIKEKNFMCEICARSFVDKVNLTVHKRTHSTLPRLQCPYCDARLKNKITLKIHMRVHNPSIHTCTICSKELATKNALMNHIQYVHSEKKFKCTICDKTFKKALTLKVTCLIVLNT